MDLTELQPFLDLVPQPVFVLRSITGEILLANSSACSIYGLVPDDFDTKTLGDLGFVDDPGQGVQPSSILHLRAGDCAQVGFSLHTPSGGYRFVSVSAASVALDGPRPFILMLPTDVTPLHDLTWQALSSEGTLRAIVEANFALCYEWNLTSGNIQFWGHFDELLGLAADETPGSIEDWLRFVHPDDIARVVKKNQTSIDEICPYLDEYRMIHRNGAHVIVSDSGHILTDDNGKPDKMVGGIRDVTRERKTQQTLEERNTALRVILDQRTHDRLELERNIHENVRALILPALDRVGRSLGDRPEVGELESLRQTLAEIVGPFARRLGSNVLGSQPFTQREVEIIDLVRRGKTSQEIAEILVLSSATVSYHRTNIRRKLNVPRGGPRLATHLLTLERHDSDDEEEMNALLKRIDS